MPEGFMLFRRFGVGVLLILAAITILLWSDPKRLGLEKSADNSVQIAVVTYASVPVLEEGVEGLLAGLKDSGFDEGESCQIRIFNAENDRTTAALIAKEIVGDTFDLVTTISTPTLQAVAAANVETKINHVFTLTTDPWGAGIGVSRDNPDDHPPYMTGYGSLQPVEALFRLALVANPNLKRVGVVWNPSEANSESSTLAARVACEKLNIELIEATVDTSSGVVEAVNSLISRDVEAIWSGGDSTVAAARDSMIGATSNAGIPVFTNIPNDVQQGALFCLGADYYQVAYAGGLLAARVLNGESPKDIPVENVVPELLALNYQVQPIYSKNWTFVDDWKTRAEMTIDSDGSLIVTQKVLPEGEGEGEGEVD
jgi:ABC-type uncharacterized transport system substrate-binding protein